MSRAKFWALALGGSAVVHVVILGLVFWVLHVVRPQETPKPEVVKPSGGAMRLISTGVQARAPVAPAAAPAPEVARKTAPVVREVSGTVPVVAAAAAEVADEVSGTSHEVSGASGGGGEQPGPPSVGGSGTGSAPVNEVSGTAALHARLQAGAAACYPASLKRFRVSGQSQVSFCVDAGGGLQTPTLLAPSAHPALDEAAVGCVLPRAAPFEAGERGRCFSVAVRFGGP